MFVVPLHRRRIADCCACMPVKASNAVRFSHAIGTSALMPPEDEDFPIPARDAKAAPRNLRRLLGVWFVWNIRRYPGKPREQELSVDTVQWHSLKLKARYLPASHEIIVTPKAPVELFSEALHIELSAHNQPVALHKRRDPGDFWRTLLTQSGNQVFSRIMSLHDKHQTAPDKAEKRFCGLFVYQNMIKHVGKVSFGFIEAVLSSFSRHRPYEVRELAANGCQVLCARTLVQARPALAGEPVPESNSGQTYDHCYGMYDHPKREIIIAEYSTRPKTGELVKTPHATKTTHHEIGHARDMAADFFSLGDAADVAYRADLGKLSPLERKLVAMLLDMSPGQLETDRARLEVFARIYTRQVEKRHARRNPALKLPRSVGMVWDRFSLFSKLICDDFVS